MKRNYIDLLIIFAVAIVVSTTSFAEIPDVTPTPFKPTTKSLSALAKQLKAAFKNVGSDINSLGQSFAETLGTKTTWTGNAISATSTGVNLQPITVIFTPDPADNTTGTWSSSPVSLADLGSSASGDWAIFGSAMYLFNIKPGLGSSSATLLITLPQPGEQLLSFQLGNVSPPVFVTLE